MAVTEILLHLGLGWLEGTVSLLLVGWIARLAERARVPDHPRTERWLTLASTVWVALLLGWGSANVRPWAVELAGVLIAMAVWMRWRRRSRPDAAEV